MDPLRAALVALRVEVPHPPQAAVGGAAEPLEAKHVPALHGGGDGVRQRGGDVELHDAVDRTAPGRARGSDHAEPGHPVGAPALDAPARSDHPHHLRRQRAVIATPVTDPCARTYSRDQGSSTGVGAMYGATESEV